MRQIASRRRVVASRASARYAAQKLGKGAEQIARLLRPNRAWHHLNPFVPLLLDADATLEDIKLRYRKLSTLVHPDKNRGAEDDAREAFEEVRS